MVRSEIMEAVNHFTYNAETGGLFRIYSDGSIALAESISRHGYIRSSYKGCKFFAHRMAWRLHYGVWPNGLIDHKNGVCHDNRIKNLRVVCSSQNQQNRHVTRGTSRFKGVVFHKQTGKWQAQIKKSGVNKYLGLYETEDSAARAYANHAMALFGEYANPTRPIARASGGDA